MLKKGEAYIDQYQRGITINQYFIEKGYMDAAGVINVEKTVGRKLKSGKGTDNKDVYKIEEGDLVYYSPEGVKEVLAENVMEGEVSNTPEDSSQIKYEFDAATGTITGIKNKESYYEGSQNCILPETEIYIPSQINGVTVKKISAGYHDGTMWGVFADCKNITKVVIPETVTQIGDGDNSIDFSGCTNLKEVIIESPNITLYNRNYTIFNNSCNNLERIIFTNITEANAPAGAPWGAPSSCEVIYGLEYDFDASTGTITGIKNKESYYAGTNTYDQAMGVWAEGGVCTLPATKIYIPSHINGVEVKAIASRYRAASGVFNFSNITKIVIPETVTQIGSGEEFMFTNEFGGCTNLKEVIIESPTISFTGDSHFRDCTNLEKITFTNITEANAPAGAPWGAPSSCTIQYK